MESDGDQRRPERRARQLIGPDGLSYGSDDGDVDRMGPMGDIAAERRQAATPRAWGDYPVAREDAEVSIASRPRTRAMTAEQEKWVHDLTTHPVLAQTSTGGPSTPREPREYTSNPLANPSLGDFSCQGGSLMDGASRASTVPMTTSPAPGSGRGESGDGDGSDLLRGNDLGGESHPGECRADRNSELSPEGQRTNGC